jgi:C-methyltransferase
MQTPDQNPTLRLHEMAYSLGVTAALHAAAELGIADVLADTPMRVESLAAAVGAHPDALHQLMRALSWHGVFTEVAPREYGHSALSLTLREDAPNSRKPWVRVAGAGFAWQVWSRLTDSIRTGRAVFPEIFGTDLFSYLAEREPEMGRVLDDASATSLEAALGALADVVQVGDAATVADIGGGTGKLLRSLLRRHPGLRGVLMELPRVLGEVEPELRDRGALVGRCEIVVGDCREDVPVKADIYLLKGIVHTWDDATAAAVLANIARNARAGATVIIMDQLLDATATPRMAGVFDLLMLASQGGRERTREEFAALFGRAGFELRRTVPVTPVMHLIEAGLRPAG